MLGLALGQSHFTLDEARFPVQIDGHQGESFLHWKTGFIKCEVALAKGKAEHDKRDTIKDREGKREIERAMKSRNR